MPLAAMQVKADIKKRTLRRSNRIWLKSAAPNNPSSDGSVRAGATSLHAMTTHPPCLLAAKRT
jgi:hypothetical protein